MPKVGATILNGVSYAGWQALPDHGITLDEKRRKEELALESMSRLMKVAENCGVLYCCEVVNRFEQYLLNTAKEGVEFVKRLGSPNARVLLDTFHMNIEEDSMVDAILEAGPWLGHFHVGENNRRPAGSTNRLPWKDMAAALKQVNYQGAIVMAVSYTHLDVYKRQASTCPSTPPPRTTGRWCSSSGMTPCPWARW